MISKSTSDPNGDLRLFRVIGFQFENAMVGFCRARNVGEMDEKYLPLINLFYPVSHLFAEVKKACLKFQGFVSFRPDFNGFGDGLTHSSSKVDLTWRELDGYPDKGLDS